MAILKVQPFARGAGVVLDGELDISSVAVLLAGIEDMAEDGELVLDLSNLRFIDSSGLRAVIQLAQRRNGGSTIVLRRPTPAVERVLAIALPHGMPGLRIELDETRDG